MICGRSDTPHPVVWDLVSVADLHSDQRCLTLPGYRQHLRRAGLGLLQALILFFPPLPAAIFSNFVRDFVGVGLWRRRIPGSKLTMLRGPVDSGRIMSSDLDWKENDDHSAGSIRFLANVEATWQWSPREVETLGYGPIWVGRLPGRRSGRGRGCCSTPPSRTPVVTGIVNMWREDAETVAASYTPSPAIIPSVLARSLFGIGHREATQEYRNPLAKIGDYLDRLDSAEVPRDRLVLAALGPKALRIAAERTAGAHPYLTTPAHTAFAREVMGEGPLLAPEHKVALDEDAKTARVTGRRMVSNYLGRYYRNNLLRSGWAEADLANGGSDALVDALVLHGTPDQVASGLEGHLDADADHVGVQVLGDDPMRAYRRLAEVLPFNR